MGRWRAPFEDAPRPYPDCSEGLDRVLTGVGGPGGEEGGFPFQPVLPDRARADRPDRSFRHRVDQETLRSHSIRNWIRTPL